MTASRWICKICGWIYDERIGDPDSGIAPGTSFEEIPEDWSCPLCGVSKADFVTLEDFSAQRAGTHEARSRPPLAKRQVVGGEDAVVIVGAGYAGWTIAERLRSQNSERSITLITDDEGCVYQKPALSMAIRLGRSAKDLIEQSGTNKSKELGVILQAHTRVIGLKPAERRILTTKGNVKYGELVLALGASQRRGRFKGDAADEILRINHILSYQRLRGKVSASPRNIVVIGAGLIGVELADDLSSAGHHVTLLDLNEQLLARLAPQPIANRLLEVFRKKGIIFFPGISLASLDYAGDGYLATLTNGNVLKTDLVISAMGLIPNIELAKKAGLKVNRGIIARASDMRTSDEHIFALGDCVEVNGNCSFFIEPIKRQAESVSAALCGTTSPLENRKIAIRVKTTSLPILLCPPDLDEVDRGSWFLQVEHGIDCRMVFMADKRVAGYALCGKETATGRYLADHGLTLTGS